MPQANVVARPTATTLACGRLLARWCVASDAPDAPAPRTTLLRNLIHDCEPRIKWRGTSNAAACEFYARTQSYLIRMQCSGESAGYCTSDTPDATHIMETHPVDGATPSAGNDNHTNEDVIPERMRYGHISRAADASMANLTDDPLVVYLSDGPKEGDGGLIRAVQKAANSYAWWREVEHKVAWTIHGDSFIIFHPTRDDGERMKTPLDKFLCFLVSRLTGMFPEQETSKRYAEFTSKREAAISASLGDEVHDMVYIDNLITMREARGRGYASALVHMVTSLADKEGRGAWLVSSNIANERFYNSLGFTTVERFTIGENNPTWDKPPVPIDIMARKPPCKISVAEKFSAPTDGSA